MINPCYSSPCANNGSCVPMGPFDYTCQCAVGYTGLTCEIDIDHCLSALCSNNSMCVDGVNSYECICYPDFMLDEDRCVNQMENQGKSAVAIIISCIANVGWQRALALYHNPGTPIPVTSSFATEAANGNKITIYYGVAAAVALTVIAIIAFTMALIVVIIKWRRKRIHCAHQGEGNWMNTCACTHAIGSPSASLYMQRSIALFMLINVSIHHAYKLTWFSHCSCNQSHFR